MKIRIAPAQVQKPILAPSMRQSIEVLLLPILDLNTVIEQELQSNPLLEVDEEKTKIGQNQLDRLMNLNLQHFRDGSSLPTYDTNADDDRVDEKPISRTTPLEDYLLQQLRLETNNPEEIKIGEMIIGSLNEDGFLLAGPEEIAELLGSEKYNMVKQVLSMIQGFEPLGLATRDIKESLLVQAHYRFNGDSELVRRIIEDHLDDVATKKFNLIARKLKTPLEEIKNTTQLIAKLEPKPARKYRPINTNVYVKPDISITKNEADEYQIQINRDVPQLRINKVYQNMLQQPNRTEEELNFIKEKIRNAFSFIKSIEQRNETMTNIAKYILEHQKDFFEEEDMLLRPMVLRDVAGAIDRNESTICRAINNKYIDTPQGMFPLKFFFSHAVSKENEEGPVSCQNMKEEMRALINEEDKRRPFSDHKIQLLLKQKGLHLARRTISKYRQALQILPSHLRKS